VIVFIVEFLNNCGVPLPGDTIVLGAGFILGKNTISLWEPMVAGTAGCFLGGLWAFWLGRRLGHSRLIKIRWLHFTPERVQWTESFYKRLGPRAVFIARFIFLLPPVAANLMAGMAKMKWRIFLFYNFTGSAVYVVSYILIGYFFGRRWILLKAWMGPTALYMILAGLALVAIVVVWRRYFPKLFAGLLPLKRKRR
jgi:membrane-associated protein